jgi:hypothetical protein
LFFAGALSDFGSLADGRYTMTVLASHVFSVNGLLDGNGDGTPGGNYTFNLHRLFGDADGNATVNSSDFASFRTAFGLGVSMFDFNNDGQTNSSDFAEFRTRFGITVVP